MSRSREDAADLEAQKVAYLRSLDRRPSEIAELVGKSPAHISRLLDRAEKRGFSKNVYVFNESAIPPENLREIRSDFGHGELEEEVLATLKKRSAAIRSVRIAGPQDPASDTADPRGGRG